MNTTARIRLSLCVMPCAVLLACAASSPTAPSPVVIGVWDFSFTVFDARACTGTPGIRPGCAGSGQLDFLATEPLDATHSYRASCQSCTGAADYGVFEGPLTSARLTGDTLEFSLAACRFTAALPHTPAPTVAGAVVCTPSAQDPEVRGNWTMSRR